MRGDFAGVKHSALVQFIMVCVSVCVCVCLCVYVCVGVCVCSCVCGYFKNIAKKVNSDFRSYQSISKSGMVPKHIQKQLFGRTRVSQRVG